MIAMKSAVVPVDIREMLPYKGANFVAECLSKDEVGDARLFAELYHTRAVYDHRENAWYLWAGHAWKRDTTQQVRRLVTGQLVGQYFGLAAELAPQVAAQNTHSQKLLGDATTARPCARHTAPH